MQQKSEILLILDLDETLIHSSRTRLLNAEDFTFDDYFVYKRPYLNKFLEGISKHFQLGVWSTAGDEYVTEIVRYIKRETIDLAFCWGRSKCSTRRDRELDTYFFEKRLDKLKKQGFQLDKILIVDDSPEKSITNYGNAIHIKPFTGEPDDEELLHLFRYLVSLKEVENVRMLEKRYWRNKIGGA